MHSKLADTEKAKVLREERKSLVEEVINRRRVKELETALNDDRSKRLKDMRENELLRLKCARLEGSLKDSSSDVLSAESKYLDKLQQHESLISRIESQKRIFESQGYKMVDMVKEIAKIKEDSRHLHEIVKQRDQELARERPSMSDPALDFCRMRHQYSIRRVLPNRYCERLWRALLYDIIFFEFTISIDYWKVVKRPLVFEAEQCHLMSRLFVFSLLKIWCYRSRSHHHIYDCLFSDIIA